MGKTHWCKEAKELDEKDGFAVSSVTKESEDFGWYLFYDYERHQIIYCPYCGVLLTDEVAEDF